MTIGSTLRFEVLVACIRCALEGPLSGPPTMNVSDVLGQSLLIHRLVLAAGDSAWDLWGRFSLCARTGHKLLRRRRDEVRVFFSLALVDRLDISLHLLELAGTTGCLGCDEIGKACLAASLTTFLETGKTSGTLGLTTSLQRWKPCSTLILDALACQLPVDQEDGRVLGIVVQNDPFFLSVA